MITNDPLTTPLTAADLFGFDDALAYVNAALSESGGRPLSVPGFRRHVYDGPNGIFQLEPIPLGMRSRDDGPDRATGVVFTRRMLDAYLADRPHNERYGAEQRVTRPTDAERAQVMGLGPALAYVNAALAAAGSSSRLTEDILGYRRRQGKVGYRMAGRVAAYTAADLDVLTAELLERGR